MKAETFLLGRLTWEQAQALVEQGYNPHRHLDPSLRIVKFPPVESPELRQFGEEFLAKFQKRLEDRDGRG